MFSFCLVLALAAAATSPGDEVGSTALSAEMHERFARATMIQSALIDGDLEEARERARELAAMAPPDPAYADLRTRFASLAEVVAEAASIPEAAVATARIAGACGACHELHGVGAHHFESDTPFPQAENGPDRMARHGWAVDRLWEGLIGRLDLSWTSGSEALMTAPLGVTASERPEQRRVEAMSQCIRDLGREALETARWQPREQLYGRVLASCASCHRAVRDEPDAGDLVTCGMQTWY